jgi:GT2 family glycosyltransferase
VLEIDVDKDMKMQPAWVNRGKTIRQLIRELQSFKDQDLVVEISVDDGKTRKAISLVKKSQGNCLLVNSENASE